MKITRTALLFSLVAFPFFMTTTFPQQSATAGKKIFIVTGEASGDYLGAWYLKKLQAQHPQLTAEAIGGAQLKKMNVPIYEHFNNLTLGFVGPLSFLYHLPKRWRTHKQLVKHVLDNDFTDVVLVDCPLTNLPLARSLKKKKPEINIIYVAPPELWIWGRWGIDSLLKSYCDKTVVIYPFEVDWYKKHGLTVQWEGYPYYNDFVSHKDDVAKTKNIALLPGSRRSELKTMLPILTDVAKRFRCIYPDVSFLMPVAQSFSEEEVRELLKQEGVESFVKTISSNNEDEKQRALQSCCLAITKPGTITLILSLLGVPAVIAYRVPFLTYLFARLTIQVPFVGLPNLLAGKELYKELMQSACTPSNIFEEAHKIYREFLDDPVAYQKRTNELLQLHEILLGKETSEPENQNSPLAITPQVG